MASFSQEFRKYQKQERFLTATIVLGAVLAPVLFTWLMDMKVHWVLAGGAALLVVLTATGVHIYRDKVAKKILKHYEDLEVGSVLAKKISPKKPTQFVITNTGYNHFYLKCLSTGEQVLVSKRRIREDFDIAN